VLYKRRGSEKIEHGMPRLAAALPGPQVNAFNGICSIKKLFCQHYFPGKIQSYQEQKISNNYRYND
jgi:hypothetical protein